MEFKEEVKTPNPADGNAELPTKKAKLLDPVFSVESRYKRFIVKHLMLNDDGDPFEIQSYSNAEIIRFHWKQMLEIRDHFEKSSGFGERKKTTIFVGLAKEELLELMKDAAKFENEGLYACIHPVRLMELQKREIADRSNETNLPIGRIIQFGIPGDLSQPYSKPWSSISIQELVPSDLEGLQVKTDFKGFVTTSSATPPETEGLPSTPESWASSMDSPKSKMGISEKFMSGSASSGSQQGSPQKSTTSSNDSGSQKSLENGNERIASIAGNDLDPLEFRALDDQRVEYTFDIVWGVGYPLIKLSRNDDGTLLPVHLDSVFWVQNDEISSEQDIVKSQEKVDFITQVRLKCGLVGGTTFQQVKNDPSHPTGCGALLKFSTLKFEGLHLDVEGDAEEPPINLD